MSKWIWVIIGLALLAGGAVKFGLESIIETMASAIKEFEGWYAGSRSYRNNNPGNIRWKGTIPLNGSGVLRGAVGKDSTNHIIYDSYQSGWDALKFQIRIAFTNQSNVYNSNMSFYDFFDEYAEENSSNYAKEVASALGVSPETKLGDLLS